jgi:nucleotide-binding universal stress UspA family protein
MVNNEAQQHYENVVAPVEMSETSADALRAAVSLGLIGARGATLLHGFMPLAKGKMFIAGTDQADIDKYVATERHRAKDELSKCLAASDLSGNRWSIRAEEGRPMEVISRAVSDLRPDLLVMGTHQRSGLSKALIGSVTEQALRSLGVDILAVPPQKRP